MFSNKIISYFLFFLVSIFISVFYFNFINLSVDTIALFLSSKIFLGKWLLKGIIPLYNPHIFTGIPFIFDFGLGNLHPFNLIFVFPYPLSFAVWTIVVSLLYLFGYYSLFNKIGKTNFINTLGVLILFFSGSGFFFRMNNPTILIVIAHYGYFLSSLFLLKQKRWLAYIQPLIWGILLALAGHIQFIIYGYILGLIFSSIFGIPIKKIVIYFGLLLVLTSWYFIFSIPPLLSSTRITDVMQINGILPVQLLQLLIPFIFGQIQTGARWIIDPNYNLIISQIVLIFLTYLIIRRKLSKYTVAAILLIILVSMGWIVLPLMRTADQILIFLDLILVILLVRNYKIWIDFFKDKRIKQLITIGIAVLPVIIIFLYSSLFAHAFLKILQLMKKSSLFYDLATVTAIGKLSAKSLLIWELFFITYYLISQNIKRIYLIFIFLIIESFILNYSHNYFIPQKIIADSNRQLDIGIDLTNYRIQSASDVVPYFGLFNYIDNIHFRPPFAKEKSLIDKQELQEYAYLKNIFRIIPSSWSMVVNVYSVQGYSTLVPTKIGNYFKDRSNDMESVYSYIIKRNPTFTHRPVTSINSIETSYVTLYDKRWQDLAVRYVLSDRPLDKYILLKKENYFLYENLQAPSIYSVVKSNGQRQIKTPIKQTPNDLIFNVLPEDVGKKWQLIINPDGMEVTLNNIQIAKKSQGLKLMLTPNKTGQLKVSYSPLRHLKELFQIYAM